MRCRSHVIGAVVVIAAAAGPLAAQPPAGGQRLPHLATPPQLGQTPVPTAKDLEDYNQFIAGVVDPKYTLDLIEGRARLVLFKTAPTRTQIVDESVATFRLLEPNATQMTVVGRRTGITNLFLWFPEPPPAGRERAFGSVVRVLPDPEEKARQAARAEARAAEVNRAVPNSRIRLTPVGAGTIATVQAHAPRDAEVVRRLAR